MSSDKSQKLKRFHNISIEFPAGVLWAAGSESSQCLSESLRWTHRYTTRTRTAESAGNSQETAQTVEGQRTLIVTPHNTNHFCRKSLALNSTHNIKMHLVSRMSKQRFPLTCCIWRWSWRRVVWWHQCRSVKLNWPVRTAVCPAWAARG